MSSLGHQYACSHQWIPNSISYSRFSTKPFQIPHQNFSINRNLTLNNPALIPLTNHILALKTRGKKHYLSAISINSQYENDIGDDESISFDKYHKTQQVKQEPQEKSFWAAVSLIIGTAVGPGMLGLPAATIKSGPLPSTITIILSWIYVISSILLVAELSFAVMEEDNLAEVSFTALAMKTLGNRIGSFVALVYASLSFSLLVACVSGIGSLISQWIPWLNPVIAHALFPFVAGTIICFFPFKTTDIANRFLCFIMLLSITSLVAIGLSVGRTNILSSFLHASWGLSSILPAIPVTVLTLGFHVITPFICKIAGNTLNDARKAILFGGFVPLVMVLSWNLIVLGLTGANPASSSKDPISLLLSVNSSALTAVQGFAFSALATSFIGYAVSFPKQVVDTIELIFLGSNTNQENSGQSHKNSVENGDGKVGFVSYSQRRAVGDVGMILYSGVSCISVSETKQTYGFSLLQSIVMPLVLVVPVFVASFFRSTFSAALDFAGIYANCFLFGILPPVMAYIYKCRKKNRYV